MLRLVLIASLVLKVLMFRDALRRGVPGHWFLIIALLPGGELAYLAIHKLGLGRPAKRVGWGAERRAPVAPQLRVSFERARALYDEGRYREAGQLLELLLDREPSHPEALYLLAMAHMQFDLFEEAIEPLERLVEIKAGYNDYAAFKLLARVHEQRGDIDQAVAQLERLVDRSPRLEHHVLLAEQLVRAERPADAEEALFRARNKKGEAEWVERRDQLRDRLA